MKTSEEFGQALQQIIDRHRQDLSILLEDYGYDENITPADLVTLYNANAPLLLLTMSNLPVDRELSHIEGDTTLDKLSNLFKKGMDLFGIARDTSNEVTATSGSAPATTAPPADQKTSKTRIYLIVGVVVVIVLTIVLITLKRKK